MFDEKLKAEVREKQFPVDCQNAFELGQISRKSCEIVRKVNE